MFFLLITDITDKNLFNNSSNRVFDDVCLCIYPMYHMHACVLLKISEMIDSKHTRDKREELGLISYYKVLTLPVKRYSVI